MKRACERSWEAESLEDGRLGSAERNSFERHALVCDTCRNELASLRLVREAMKQLPQFESNTFEHRHQRNRLLQRASFTVTEPPPRRRRPTWMAFALAGFALMGIASASVLLGGRTPKPPEKKAPAVTTTILPAPRSTRAIAPPQSELVATASPSSSAVGNDPLEPSPHGIAKLPVAPVPHTSAKPRTSAATAPTSALSAAAVAPPASDSFGVAIAAFRAGSYARADRLFAEFVATASRDPRAEDAAFLRAVSRSRLGDTAGAAALARDYLRAFPHGLRRAEAERLAGVRP